MFFEISGDKGVQNPRHKMSNREAMLEEEIKKTIFSEAVLEAEITKNQFS